MAHELEEMLNEENDSKTPAVNEEQPIAEEETIDNVEEATTEDDAQEEVIEEDYSVLSQEDLLSKLVDIVKDDATFKRGKAVDTISNLLYPHFDAQKEEAYQRYIADGGEKDGFEYRNTDLEEFKALVGEYNRNKRSYQKDISAKKEENLKKKEEILETLRTACDDQSSAGFNAVKKLQEEWKAAEPIPNGAGNELWANYKALLNRFYNNRSLNNQLRDLDKKKNYEVKVKLCEEAEALSSEKSIQEALRKLNILHDDYKKAGPVSDEHQELLWSRFKKASDDVYHRKKEYQSQQKEVWNKNEEAKKGLIEQIREYVNFSSDKANEWKNAANEVMQLQEKWKKAGPVSRNSGKDLNKEFWSLSKMFFKNKSAFYAVLAGDPEENLKKKEALCEEAEALLESMVVGEEGQEVEADKDLSHDFINLQKKWKNIGPASKEHNDKIYERFKKACDTYFDKKREERNKEFQVFEENLAQKKALCETFSEKSSVSFEELDVFIDEYEALGEIPRKSADGLGKTFLAVTEKHVNGLKLDEDEEADLRLRLKVVSLQDNMNANKIIDTDRKQIRKQITELENDMNTWETNIEFFARSSNASELRAEIDKKIETAKIKVAQLKKNLKRINSLRKG